MKRVVLIVLVAFITAYSVAMADNWPSWRGPTYNGVAGGSNYPTEWSEGAEGEEGKNILWKVQLPGVGGSTPAVWEDFIFLTSGDNGKNAVLCFNQDGKPLWTTHVGEERAGKHPVKGSGANPSPTTDGEHLFVYFKSGDFACLDYKGSIVWQHNLQEMYGEDTLWWDLGTSPVLTKDNVVVACVHSGPSYVAAFNKASGELAWKHDRNLEAPEESQQTYSTPIPTTINGREAIIVLGADHVTAHDAQDGKEIWRLGGLNPGGNRYDRSIASPVIENGIVVVPYERGTLLRAVPVDSKGDVTNDYLWSTTDISADVPTPAAKDGRIYVCNDQGRVACLDVKDGNIIWEGKVEKRGGGAQYSASPIIADDKLYVTYENGTTTVLALGDEFKPIAVNKLKEFVVATPVFVDGKIFIRTAENLYCIAQ